jgi:hypothetical protein
MGFDIYIHCSFNICKDTGKLYYYKGLNKVYDMPEPVPEEYREFVKMRGHVFGIYTKLVTDWTSTSVENFLDKYPNWCDILDDDDFEDISSYWCESHHIRFYEALKWFSKQDISYTISWDY